MKWFGVLLAFLALCGCERSACNRMADCDVYCDQRATADRSDYYRDLRCQACLLQRNR